MSESSLIAPAKSCSWQLQFLACLNLEWTVYADQNMKPGIQVVAGHVPESSMSDHSTGQESVKGTDSAMYFLGNEESPSSM